MTTPDHALLVSLMDRYLGGLLDPFVSLLEVHKLMYFAQEAGQPLRLKYVKGTYGPYAENLRHVLGHIEGHLIAVSELLSRSTALMYRVCKLLTRPVQGCH